MKQHGHAVVFVLVVIALNALKISAQAPLTVRQIMAEPSIAGMRPDGERISPDGKWVAFTWSDKGVEPRDLYVVSTTNGAPMLLVNAAELARSQPAPAPTTGPARDAFQQAREQTISGLDWSPDSSRIVFIQRGDLFVGEGSRPGTPLRLTRTEAAESNARWLDDNRILYQSSGNLFAIQLDRPGLVQITREGAAPNNPQGGMSIGNITNTEDGRSVAYVVTDASKQRALLVPNYLGDFVTAPTVRRGWSEQTLQIAKTDGTSAKPVAAKLPAPEGSSSIRGLHWTDDGSILIVDRIDRDTKRRQLFRVDPNDGAAALIDEETDAKWIAPLSRFVEPSPKGDALVFGSERDGFNHLYLVPLPTKYTAERLAVRQLTRGKWEVDWARWSADGSRILMSSTSGNPAHRVIELLDPANGQRTAVVTDAGMNTGPQLSRNGEYLLFEHSEWNVPTDLFTTRVCVDCRDTPKPRRLTESAPAAFSKFPWSSPKFLEYQAKDGKLVKARVYLPTEFDKTKRYPAVVFVHGAGYLQNVINGWNNYYREAMFNALLTQHGYVVLDIDYRGSAGYGREWRTDVYDFLGGLDLQDHLDGIDFIVKNFSVDKTRVGMYGGSYGGFMAEMAAMRAPDYIAAAAALRPVADWRNYFASSPNYTTERLGFPDKNPEAYKRSSPITYADKLERPLLILHGMVDDNVHFQDSAQLIEKLIKLGKTRYFETMFYPSENHAFTRPESWTDEYERIFDFFERNLKSSSR